MNSKQPKPVPGSSEWENICQRCGRCCYEKIDYRDKIFYTRTPCPHLELSDNSCRIYFERDHLHPDCVRLTPELVEAGFLPADCPHVADLPDYQAPESDDW